MAKIDWNDNQKDAINHKGLGIVVSAAAGSGKTAVLVERIIRRISDENDPVDFDKFLIVTFTKAAAKEMNQRLRSELNKRISENPGNRHLLRQKRLLPLANISSIDSFLNSIVREYFHVLNITPDFRIIDSAEEKLLIKESFNETSEKFYEEGTPEFSQLIDIIGNEKSDDGLFEIVKTLNGYAKSHVNPEKWLESVSESYNQDLPVAETRFGKVILEHITETATYALSIIDKALELLEDYEGLEVLYEMFLNEKAAAERILELANEKSWDELQSYLNCVDEAFKTFPTKSIKEDLRSTNEFCASSSLRAREKSLIVSLKNDIVANEAQFKEDMHKLYPVVSELIRFILEYRNTYDAKKAENNMFDFDDITHLAIKLLINEDGTPSDVALEIRRRYAEILIDEYQDTNEAQDAIFKAISKDLKNLFLVGDVKQAVYGFRLATPYMFIEKIREWKLEENDYAEYINLDSNYRSRKSILDCVNYVFRKTMSKNVGDIEYNGEEELKNGYKFPTPDKKQVELDIVVKPQKSDNISEPVFVARRIKEILANETIYDKGLKKERPVNLSDICILCRSNDGCKKFANTLNDEGVSAYYSEKKGFFDRLEIKVMFSLLQILDNPLQDIPLLAVLSSPIFGFTADELAKIRINKRKGKLYYAIKQATDEKSKYFIEQYNRFRSLAGVLSVSALIRELYEQTGYYTVAGALTNGEFRQMNLMLLLDYAASYEDNSNLGLSGFVRYLERCRDSGADIETASTVSEGADVVNVMTIHKSKGLEFPIVFLVGTDNRKHGVNKTLAIDEQVGVGLSVCDKKRFQSYQTVQYKAAAIKQGHREYSEELRLLYVAMTRAMERMIITAEFQVPENRISAISYSGLLDNVDPIEVMQSNTIALILKTFMKHRDCQQIRKLISFDIKAETESDFDLNFNFINETYEDVEAEELEKQKPTADEKTVELIRQRADYKYPYEQLSRLVTKKSASSFNDDSLKAGEYFAFEVPQFAVTDTMTGAEKGTAMHRFMEVCDFSLAEKDVAAERDRLADEGLITAQQASALDVDAIKKFFESDVYARIKKSDRVLREHKFTVFVPAAFVDPELPETAADEKVLVQGVIDCAFFENGKATVLDYKTDRVSSGKRLAELYHRQLEVYKTAAEQSFECEVGELLLYSFALGKQVEL